jgi:CBS domain containing-hemolysin-like protein
LVHWLGRALGPLATVLIRIGNAFTPGVGFREGPFATQVELRELVDLAEQRGVVEHDERDMLHSVFALGDTIAREVMVPRTEMVWVEAHKSAQQALMLALRSGFSRLPVIGETVDDVLGVVYLKDLVRRTQTDGGAGVDGAQVEVGELMRGAAYVPESKHVDELLREMQAARTHMAIVVDEYGGTAGLVTIEDILEEIVGEIADEYDRELPPVEWLGHDQARVTARLSVEELEELFDVSIEAEDVETVGGLLAQRLGRVPIPGAVATVAGLRLTAESLAGRRNRIGTVRVERIGAEGEAAGGERGVTAGNGARTGSAGTGPEDSEPAGGGARGSGAGSGTARGGAAGTRGNGGDHGAQRAQPGRENGAQDSRAAGNGAGESGGGRRS